MGKVQENRLRKRQALLDAAYELFTELGQSRTSIDSIVTRANVAKGTFYLYFADKEDITQTLIWNISDRFFEQALAKVKEMENLSYVDQVLALVDHVIEELRENPAALQLFRHNLRWPQVDELTKRGEPSTLLSKIIDFLRSSPEFSDRDKLELYRRLTAVVSMCVSVCYGCVIEGRPDDLDNMKPVLYDIICKSLQ